MMGTLALGLVSCADDGEGNGGLIETPPAIATDSQPSTDKTETQQKPVEEEVVKAAVVKPVKDIAKGQKITADDVSVVYMNEDQIAFNALRSVDDVVGKYAKMKLYKNDFIMAAKVSDKKEEDVQYTASTTYIVVTDHDIDATGKTNVAGKIQTLINKFPGRAIYFPDGTYLMNSTIKTSAASNKAVSLIFSGNAKLKAGSTFQAGTPLISVGGADSGTETTSTTISGGILDCGGKATGISLDGGRDIFLSDISIINAPVGLVVTKDVNADVESLTIAGTYTDTAVGVKVNGSENTLTNIRVYGCGTGLEATKSGNTFRNIICKYNGTSATSCGFYDNSDKGNDYDGCTSNDFAIGFKIGAGAECTFSLCNILWEQATTPSQLGFKNEGAFNSVLRSCKVTGTAGKNAKFMETAQGGGKGMELYCFRINVS